MTKEGRASQVKTRFRGRGLGLPYKFIASHRGRVKVGSDDTGNTLADFRAAINAGAAMIELDVRRLADGGLVVCHDDSIDGKEVGKMTTDELKSLSPPGLMLDTCLEELRGQVLLNLELKVPGIESDAIEAIKNREWRLNDIVLTSFGQDVVKAIRAVSDEVMVGLLIDREADYPNFFDDFLLRNDADFLAPEERLLTPKRLDQAEKERVPLVPWTVNDKKQLEMLLGHPAVAGVITDNVELALGVKRLMGRRSA